MTPLSLRGRLTLWYTLALIVVLGLFGAENSNAFGLAARGRAGRVGLSLIQFVVATVGHGILRVARGQG